MATVMNVALPRSFISCVHQQRGICLPLTGASLALRPSSSAPNAARALSSSSSSCFAGVSVLPRLGVQWNLSQRGSLVKVRAGKPALGCTKRNRSRKSLARTSGFRARLATPGGRNILRRRRAKGRKRLCPASNPNHGKFA